VKTLETILASVEGLRELRGNRSLGVRAIRYDSRRVEPGDVYVAVNGRDDHGLEYLPAAIEAGATIIVADAPERTAGILADRDDLTVVIVDDARQAMAEMASALFDYPSRKLKVFGVTGTNGKTTTAYMLLQLMEACGERTGLIGTLGKYIGDFIPTGYTTPEAPELAEILHEMVEAGCTSVAMEVSSHALALHRVAGIRFHGAVFTNLTQDHLDFHQTMREYHDAKKLLFDHLDPDRAAVVNVDDIHGEGMVRDTYASIYRYGHNVSDVQISKVALGAEGTSWEVALSEKLGGGTVALRSPLVGAFNVSNVTAALTLCLALGLDRDTLVGAVRELRAVPGRMESIPLGNGAVAVVDYAHTPDALENVLRTLNDLRSGGALTVVFGCGGDRDRTKRPIMGEIAARLADRVILTSDNPRHENPEAILAEIAAGVGDARNVERIVDRRIAIEHGLATAGNGDVVLVAGKGHEDYQIVGASRIHFDDREVVRDWIARGTRNHTEKVAAA